MVNLSHLYTNLEFDKIKKKLQAHVSSELGAKRVDEIIPFEGPEELIRELNLVSQSKRILESEDQFPLSGIKDIANAVRKASIEDNYISSHEFRDILGTLRASRLIKEFMKKRTTPYGGISKLADTLYADRVLEFNIDQAIDDAGAVKDSASKELKEIRRSILSKTDSLRERLAKIVEEVSEKGYAQEEILTTRDGRMVIPVKVEHKHHVPGFIHSSSASGATVFIEPADTLEMNNEIRSLHFLEQREIERILRLLTTEIRKVRTELLSAVDTLGYLDLLFAKARYSIEIIGSEPTIADGGSLHLLNAIHPLLLQKHARKDVVPLTLKLGNGVQTLIITGPNAGGKTVALKTVGLLSLMATCGLHVPTQPDSTIPFFKEIFIDIGDEQSIENDLSSFSSHLLRMKEIIEGAGESSLVLIDEIGAGTDPAEGGALAAAILTSLTEKMALTIATTHHGALKAFAHESKGFENAAMEFDQATLQPTYRFRAGVPGSSYALEIASRLGLTKQITEHAASILGERKDRLEKLLSDIEQKRQTLEVELKQVTEQKMELEDLVSQYMSKLSSARKEAREIKSGALKEAHEIVSKANTTIEAAIQELRESQASKETVKKTKSEIKQLKSFIEKDIESIHLKEKSNSYRGDLRVGDFVRMRDRDEVGQIVAGEGRSFLVQFGSVRLKVKQEDLLPAAEEKVTRPVPMPDPQDQQFRNKVDVRGMTGDEAVNAVEKLIDQANMIAFPTITIVHGKGTGILRKRITDYLRADNRVDSVRLGEWNEGGAGVTVATLRV